MTDLNDKDKQKRAIEQLLKHCPDAYRIRYKKNSVLLSTEEYEYTLSYPAAIIFLKKRNAGRDSRSAYYG